MNAMLAAIRYHANRSFDMRKNNKLLYYINNFLMMLIPKTLCRASLNSKLMHLENLDIREISFRLSYYNRLSGKNALGADTEHLERLRLGKKQSTYFFDSYRYARYFDQKLKVRFRFGDNTVVPDSPTILKSRPVKAGNENAVLLNLNRVRHFIFVKDSTPFESKKDLLVWRGRACQPHRIRFMEMYHDHPLCNIGQVTINGNPFHWVTKRMTIDEQLAFKFILCIEGNDVASNLKWVMSSNSVAVMPKPRYETWFMEGTLLPGVHYIQIKDDYSDLEEQLRYYMNNPEKAVRISEKANRHVAQFKNQRQEDLIALLVLQKYFNATEQFHPAAEGKQLLGALQL